MDSRNFGQLPPVHKRAVFMMVRSMLPPHLRGEMYIERRDGRDMYGFNQEACLNACIAEAIAYRRERGWFVFESDEPEDLTQDYDSAPPTPEYAAAP